MRDVSFEDVVYTVNQKTLGNIEQPIKGLNSRVGMTFQRNFPAECSKNRIEWFETKCDIQYDAFPRQLIDAVLRFEFKLQLHIRFEISESTGKIRFGI